MRIIRFEGEGKLPESLKKALCVSVGAKRKSEYALHLENSLVTTTISQSSETILPYQDFLHINHKYGPLSILFSQLLISI